MEKNFIVNKFLAFVSRYCIYFAFFSLFIYLVDYFDPNLNVGVIMLKVSSILLLFSMFFMKKLDYLNSLRKSYFLTDIFLVILLLAFLISFKRQTFIEDVLLYSIFGMIIIFLLRRIYRITERWRE